MKRQTFSNFATVIIALLLATTAGIADDWSGDITTHVTWAAYSDINIVGSLTVTSSGWLTVEEGVAIDGAGTAVLEVEPGGKIAIGEANGAAVTIENVAAITLDDCDGTTLITNVEFSDCGDPLGIDPFISLHGGEDEGYLFVNCTFTTITSSSIHWDEGSKGEVSICGWFQWAGSPVIIGPTTGGNPIYLKIKENQFDGSTCGWFQWAGAPLVDAPLGGGSPVNLVIEDNDFIGYEGSGVGVYISGSEHDGDLDPEVFDINITGNKYSDLEIGVELEGVAEASSILIANNNFFENETGISVTSTDNDPVLVEISNNALFDNTTGVYVSLDGSTIPDGLVLANSVAWENEVGYDFSFANSASLDDLLFRNNVAGESSVAAFRSNVTVGSASIHHMGLKGNSSNIKVGASDGSADRFASDCIVNGVNSKSFSLVNENPGSAGWDFRLLVDDTWSGDFNNLINAGYGTDPDGFTADIGLFGGAYAATNVDKDFAVLANYRSVTTMEFFNDVTTWKPDLYRLNVVSPTVNMTSTGTIDGGSAAYPTVIEMPSGVYLYVSDNFDVEYAVFKETPGLSWKGIRFGSSSSIDYSGFANCTIQGAEYGLYLSGLDDSSGDRLPVVDCTIEDCGVGVYANQSRVWLSGVTITGSDAGTFYGVGVYLTSCASGKVLIDDCNITGNGTTGGYLSAGIYLSNSSPEIINTLVEDNSGAGITCLGSTPDLNTWNSATSSDRPNSIHSNGGDSQSGSDGAEIYLGSSSYPDIQYNNIWDYNGGPIGYMIYKHSTSNTGSLTPSNNWWGATPTSSFFYWGGGSPINYSTYSGSQLSNAYLYQLAMTAWEEGDFERAADLFSECVWDSGVLGINSIRYLSGCYAEIPDSDYDELRSYLNRVGRYHRDPLVRWAAKRYATDCLTELGEFDEAMEEYQEMIDEAENINDAVMAEIDLLSVYDLANGGDLDAASEDVVSRMGQAFARLDGEFDGRSSTLPQEFALTSVYPNPFNSITRLSYSLPEASDIRITVHDLAGRQIAELFDGRVEAGNHAAVWNAGTASAGVYFIKVDFGGTIRSEKLLLVK